MSTQVTDEALSFLASHHVATLATTGAQGPWAAAVFYVNDGFDIFFLSATHTRHGQNLAADPRVALAVQEDYPDWRKIKGLQIAGEARPVSAWEKARLLAAFRAKYPAVGLFLADPRYASAVARSFVYRLRPREIWYLDNQKGFSRRERIVP